MSLITHPNARELTKSVRATVLVFKDPRSQELLSRIAVSYTHLTLPTTPYV